MLYAVLDVILGLVLSSNLKMIEKKFSGTIENYKKVQTVQKVYIL